MIIKNTNLKPINGLAFFAPIFSLILVLVMFALHAETKERLTGFVIHSGVEAPTTENSLFYSVDKIIITVTKEGKIYLDGKIFNNSKELGQTLLENITINKKSNPEPPIVILWADKDIKYQQIIEITDIVQKLNLKILYATNQKSTLPSRGNFPKISE